MACIAYVSKRFTSASQANIQLAREIIEEYVQNGFDLTLRQLYYQFVARDLIPNTQRSYKRLGSLINDARLAGEIDWDHLVDRTRALQSLSNWETPADIIRSAACSFHVNLWEGQDFRPEVWIEKDALVGVIEPICNSLDVPFFSCRGYTSQSEMWRASQRLQGYISEGQTPVVIHLGDHDPSGIDMSRDIKDRLKLFGTRLEFIRVALNRDQIDQYNPPPNPTKVTDSRASAYMEEHGDESWELDALDPAEMENLIEKTILVYRNEKKWRVQESLEEAGRDRLSEAADRWPDVEAFLAEEY
jgi:hypothetical protein